MTGSLFSCLLLSLREPRAGMRRILGLNLPPGTGMAALLLMAVGSALLVHLSLWLMPLPENSPFAPLLASPFLTVTLQFLTLLICAILAWKVGQWFGGRASFQEALLAIAWLQAVMLAVQLVQILALFVLPVLSGFIGIAAIGLFVVLVSSFIAEIHGFTSALKVGFAAFVTFLVVIFGLTLILTPFLPPEMLQNAL